MILVPYTVTALSRQDIPDSPTDRNVVSGAIVRVFNLSGAQQTIFDNATGGGGELQKQTNANGQLTFFIPLGSYVADINGNQQSINVVSTDALQQTITNFNTTAAAQLAVQQSQFNALTVEINEAIAEVSRIETLEAIEAKATYIADFVRNEFKVWEAPYGQQPKQITDVLTTTRASEGTVNTPFGVQTRGANIARIEHDPLTGEPLGLLCEEQRTNLLPNSVYDGANGETPATGWTIAFNTGVTTTAPSPRFGGAIRVTHTGTGQREFYRRSIAVLPSTTYTVSAYIAEASPTAGAVIAIGGLSSGFTGATSLPASLVSANRVNSITFTTSPTQTGTINVDIGLGCTGNATGTVIHETPQLEAGSFPTSYIPTEASAATRVGGLFDITNPPINTTDEFTLFFAFKYKSSSTIGTSGLFEIGPAGATINGIDCRIGANGALSFFDGSNGIGSTPAGTLMAGGSYTLAARFKKGEPLKVWVSGVLYTLLTYNATTTNKGNLQLLRHDNAANRCMNGILRYFSMCPIALSDAELIALTSGV